MSEKFQKERNGVIYKTPSGKYIKEFINRWTKRISFDVLDCPVHATVYSYPIHRTTGYDPLKRMGAIPVKVKQTINLEVFEPGESNE